MSKSFVAFSLTLTFVFAMVVTGQETKTETKTTAKTTTKESTTASVEKEAYLGIGISPLHPAVASQLSEVINHGRGIMVANVVAGSPAEKAGLQVHDILFQYDKQDIYSTEQLVKLVRNDKPGREVVLSYIRNGKQLECSVTLGEMESRTETVGIRRRLPVPFRGQFPAPEWFSRDRFAELPANPENWTKFESLSISKDAEGNYAAKISYKLEDGSLLDRTYQGTRSEIVDAVKADKELPETAKDHVLRSLDMKVRWREFFNPADFGPFNGPGAERFEWPELDF